MAYVDQSVIDDVRAELKALNKKYGMKATASGKGTSSLTITISSGPLDFLSQIKGYYAGMQFLGQSYSVQDWQELRVVPSIIITMKINTPGKNKSI